MTRKSRNTQMFALPGPPPRNVRLGGGEYRLAGVFKHDFFAATCLYERSARVSGAVPARDKIVVKFGRSQRFAGLPMDWYARLMRNHEEAIYRRLEGLGGVPQWVGRVEPLGYAIEYIDARPLDHVGAPPEGFFDRLRAIFDAVHARGVAYCDGNKRSNILVSRDGQPCLVDFQISLRRRDELPWPIRPISAAIVRYFARRDLYHLYKHKRRICPDRLRADEEALSRHRSFLHLLHRKLTKPWRGIRRWFLRRQYQAGRLDSPTADLEDHHQPEKEAWRVPKPDDEATG